MTCHIVIMRHRITGVVSLGHFDNFCCWQLGEESSAHREGLDIMVEEIATLSYGNYDNIEVTVVGGYTDIRGDAARNSISLLKSLHEHWCGLDLNHFCVGKYNTEQGEDGGNVAILKGIAFDLKQQEMFPAIFAWGQFEDFKNQLKEKILEKIKDDDTNRLTDHSTFKPKSLKNHARTVERVSMFNDQPKTDKKIMFQVENLKKIPTPTYSNSNKPYETMSNAFKVKLRPAPTNSKNSSLGPWGNSSTNSSTSTGPPAKKANSTRKKRRKV